jgi:peptidoglycan/LPS O-acetylase OafA/YrhL
VPNQRSIGLDLLRFVAVLMVIVSHLAMEPIPASRMQFLSHVVGYGTAGVNLFFVLSGFLVSGLLFNEYKRTGELSIKRFYVRRAWKIYPAFYFFLTVSYIYARYGVGDKIRDRILVREVFFFQNYAPGYWNHTWSLAVEEHFYILLPLILLFMVKRNGGGNPFSRIPLLVLAMAALSLTLRCLTCYLQPSYGYHTHAFPTHLRIDGLFIGVLIAYYYHFRPDTFRTSLYQWRHILIGAGAASLIALRFVTASTWFCYTFWPLQEYLSASAILCGLVLCEIPKNWATRTLATIGSYSYSIYLWHMVTIYFVTPRLRDSVSWDILAAIYLVSAFAVGIAMAKLFELPMLTLRDRWFPAKIGMEQPALRMNTAKEPGATLAA